MTPKERLQWNDYEIDQLAQKWVELRRANPIERSTPLLMQAQKILPEHRRKTIPAIPHHVRLRIMHFWGLSLEAALQAQEPPPPILIEVEKEKAPDFATLSQRLDTPTLCALLASKVATEFSSLKAQLDTMNTRLGARPAEPAHTPRPAPLILAPAPAKPRLCRIALIGPLQAQWREIEAELEKARLPVEVRWTATEKMASSSLGGVDYALITRHTNHKWWDTARSQLASNRVFFQAETGVQSIVQRIRDIASMQPKT